MMSDIVEMAEHAAPQHAVLRTSIYYIRVHDHGLVYLMPVSQSIDEIGT